MKSSPEHFLLTSVTAYSGACAATKSATAALRAPSSLRWSSAMRSARPGLALSRCAHSTGSVALCEPTIAARTET